MTIHKVGGVRWIRCSTIGLLLEHEKVSQIGFDPVNLTLQRVIDKYGEPDRLNILFTNLPDRPFKTIAVLFYDKTQTQVNLLEKPGQVYNINAEATVSSVSFYSEAGYNLLTADVVTPWDGYKPYQATFP